MEREARTRLVQWHRIRSCCSGFDATLCRLQKNVKDLGMAHQKVCKQDKVKANIQSPLPATFFTQEFGTVKRPSLLYHTNLPFSISSDSPSILAVGEQRIG